MKRSKRVSLVLLGLGANSLAGCGETPQEVFVYQNPQQCVTDKRGTDAECATAFIQAQGEHIDKSPRYESKSDCERDFGASKCEERPESSSRHSSSSFSSGNRRSSSFIPLMVGYMMGAQNQRTTPQPLYRFQGSGDYRTPGGGSIPANVGSNPYGARSVAPSNLATASRPVTVSRGGFGTTALAATHSSAS